MCLPAQAFGKCVHLPSFTGCFLLAQSVIELHEQSLGKRLAGSINPSVVEDLGVFTADAHSICGTAVQIRALTFLSLERHPSKCCASWKSEIKNDLQVWFVP